MVMSARDIYVVARTSGFSKSAAVTAVAIALAESGGNKDATHRNSNGSTDYGLWQINSVHADLLRGHDWSNPTENATMARIISSNGTNWSPWTTYKNGRYRVYVGQARVAAQGRDVPTPGGTTTTPTEPQGGTADGAGTGRALGASLSVGGGISALLDPVTWIRIAMIVAGAFLLLLVLAIAMGRDILGVKRRVGL